MPVAQPPGDGAPANPAGFARPLSNASGASGKGFSFTCRAQLSEVKE
jgi:hypothetical protein